MDARFPTGVSRFVQMLGLYVHIPFCKRKCFYCDFFSQKYDLELADRYIAAIDKHSKQFKNKQIDSIYVGGGTPSILSQKQIKNLLQSLNANFNLLAVKEFTFELNPESVSRDKLSLLKGFGVNRLSMGLQSVDNRSLKYLGRVHDFKAFCDSYDMARVEGFNNINIDLIYGLPNQLVSDWIKVLKKALLFDSEHLSLYPLAIEENTPFYKEGIIISDTLQREMYDKTIEILEKNGYIHYEISNWAKDGKEAFHNTNYWRNAEYIGLGSGASGYLDRNRYKNIDNIEQYIGFIEQNLDCVLEREYIDDTLYETEAIILGLRLLSKGVSMGCFKSLQHQNFLSKCLKEGALINELGKVKFSKRSIFVSNQIVSEFM